MTTTTYGLHLTLRLAEVERRDILDDCNAVADLLVKLVGRIGMRILAGPLAGREDGDAHHSGCSSVIILYESHCAIHTYPEKGEVFMDVFSCRHFDVATVTATLSEELGYFRILEQNMFNRGVHWSVDIDREMQDWVSRRTNDLIPDEPAAELQLQES